MVQLPTGTVTFVFTDIEGSTRLLHEHGEDYATLHAAHAAIMRAAIAAGGGVEVGTEGDSFFAAFASPIGAVAAAVAAQRALAAHDWSPARTLRVRMGMHTGEGTLGGQTYVGMDVNRAARIAAAAHGGQILMSEAARGLVLHSLPDGVSVRDLGEHHLKDIVEPEHLYDLAIDGLPTDFPEPRSLDTRPNNLPEQLTSFIGREDEIAEVIRLLSSARLLTLTGAGGTGKTRLALQVADRVVSEFADGAFFVDLSSVTDPSLVPAAVAAAMRVPEVAGEPVLDTVVNDIRAKHRLLVVDNFEQVTDAAPAIEAILAGAPKVKVMVTSRFVLSARGEHEYVVPPLVPPDLDRLPDLPTLRRIEAVRLFSERAVAVQPHFRVTEQNASAVAAITARLDGLPLAIELAATRTKILTPEQMLPRLQQRLSILTTGGRTLPQRQRTLRDAIAWSNDLLDEEEQGLFARLSVFSGGWTLEAAEEVCDPSALGIDILDGLTSLVDKSLIRRTDTMDGPRFFMLETIREFAHECLESDGDLDALRRRHGELFLGLALEAEPHLTAEDQGEWLERCDVEHPNIRAALRWAIESGEADRAQEAAGALWRFWQQRGHLSEGRGWFDKVLNMPGGAGATPARVKALIGAGGVAWWQTDRQTAAGFYEEAVAIERKLDDPLGLAEALYNHAFVVAGEDVEAAAAVLEESLALFRSAGNEAGIAQVLSVLVIRDAQAGRWEAVAAGLEETTSISRRLGDRLHLAFDLVWLSFAYGRMGRLEEARSIALEALGLFRDAENSTGVGIVFSDLAFLAIWEGRHEDAVRLAGVAESIRRRTGGPPGGFAGILEDDPVKEAGAHLTEELTDRAWQEGLAMALDDAIAFAQG
jgi:predicted ATPase/class 3 adenylate cyclase